MTNYDLNQPYFWMHEIYQYEVVASPAELIESETFTELQFAAFHHGLIANIYNWVGCPVKDLGMNV